MVATGSALHLSVSGIGAERGPAGGATRPGVRLEVLKSDRILRVHAGGRLLGRFPIGLGPQPVGAKAREGDGATPEGVYSICVKNPHSRYYLSVGLDYPNAEDADRALEEGRIDEGESWLSCSGCSQRCVSHCSIGTGGHATGGRDGLVRSVSGASTEPAST